MAFIFTPFECKPDSCLCNLPHEHVSQPLAQVFIGTKVISIIFFHRFEYLPIICRIHCEARACSSSFHMDALHVGRAEQRSTPKTGCRSAINQFEFVDEASRVARVYCVFLRYDSWASNFYEFTPRYPAPHIFKVNTKHTVEF